MNSLPDVPSVVEPVLTPLQTLLYNILQAFTGAIGWVKATAGVITDNPILLVGVVLGFVGIGVGLFKRLVRV